MAEIFREPLVTPPAKKTQLTPSIAVSSTRYIGKDRFFAGDGDAPTYAWPNPRGPQWPNDRGFIGPSQNQLFTGVQLKPTLDRVIPNPVLRVSITDRGYVDPTEHWLLAPANTKPQPPEVFQNPRGVPINDRGYVDGTEFWLLAPVIPQNPFSLSSWPIPKGEPSSNGNYTFTFYYVQDTSDPFVQSWTDLPTIRKKYADILGFSAARPQYYVENFPTAKQTEWPVPYGSRRHTQLVELLRNRPFYFIDPPQPFGLSSWPVPRGPMSASDLKLLWNSLNAFLPEPAALVVFSRLALLGAG